MRIMFVGCGHPPDHLASHPVGYTHELAKRLLAQGHETAAFAPSPLSVTGGQPYSVFRRNCEGVEIYGVANRDDDGGPFDPAADICHPQCERAFRYAVKHFDPDVIHFQSLKGFPASLMAVAGEMGKPYVVSLHDHQFICPKRHLLDADGELCAGPGDGRKCAQCVEGDRPDQTREEAFAERRRLLLEWLDGAETVIAPSATAADFLAEQEIACRRVTVLSPASALAEKLWEKRSETEDEPAVMTFAFCGAVARRNAPHLLVEAAKLLRDLKGRIRITIRGQVEDETYGREIEAVIRSLGDEVPEIEFAGHYRPDSLTEIYDGVDVYVSPQIWRNPLSRATMEALGAGVPVIASMIGASSEIIGHGYNGLLFEPGNHIDLAAQIRQMVENPAMVSAMRMNFNAPNLMSWHADKMAGVYESAAAEREATRRHAELDSASEARKAA